MRKLVIALSAAFIVLSVFSFSSSKFAAINAASKLNNLAGWIWSSNVGWISLSCQNIVPACSSSDHQVTIDPFTGELAGYAWNGGVDSLNTGAGQGTGWIRFDPPGPYPENPQISAKLVGVTTASGIRRYQLQGWARACAPAADPLNCSGEADPVSQNTGGWDGWIKFSGATTNCPTLADYNPNPPGKAYETCLSADGKSLEGWAWGGDTIGWIQFGGQYGSNSVVVPPGSSKICEVRPGATACPK